MQNQLKRLRKHNFSNLSLATQIFVIFAGFIVLLIFSQFFVYQIMFSDYFIDSQKKDIDQSAKVLSSELRIVDDDNYYPKLVDYAKDTNAICVILDYNLDLTDSTYQSKSMIVVDTTNYQQYEITLPDDISVESSDRLVAGVKKNIYDNTYTMYSLTLNSEQIYVSAEKDLTEIVGIVSQVKTPSNLNATYTSNQLVINELFKLRNSDTVKNLESETSTTYITTTDISQNVIYLSDIGNGNYLLSIYVISTNNSLLDIFSAYNLAVYTIITLVAIVISVIVALRISKPIVIIDNAAKAISKKNFNVFVKEGANKETKSLSNSINTINKNLSSTISELTETNEKITSLYKVETEQTAIRRRFIQAISHELKTPLMVINLSVSGIIDNIFSEKESQEELQRVLTEVTNIDLMLKDLLDVYKIEDIESADKQEKINLKKLTAETINNIDSMLKQYNQTISVASTRSPVIYGSYRLIQMCISNIITNAVKYTKNGEKIEIAITEKKDKIKYSCVNYGAHIDEEKINHVFEAFYRCDESRTKTTKTKGTGLGLYIFSETMNSHNYDYGIKNVKDGVMIYFVAKKFQ